MLSPQIQSRIDKKLQRYIRVSHAQKTTLATLLEEATLQMVYNSCALAGNTLSYHQVRKIVQHTITVGNKPIQDVFDVHNYAETLSYLSTLREQVVSKIVSRGLLDILYACMVRTSGMSADSPYRTSDFTKTAPIRKLPHAKAIPQLMRAHCAWLQSHRTMHIIEYSALSHYKFLSIHPYKEGNGRLARILTGHLFSLHGYPPFIILYNDKKRYISALKNADRGNMEPLINFFAQCIERSLDAFLRALEPPTPGLHEFYLPLSRVAQRFPYSKKYLNLLVRTGKLEAYKKGRNWVTSVEAVKRYIELRKRNRDLHR